MRGVHGLIIVPFYDILTVQTCEYVAQFCEWIPIYWGNVPSVYRGGSRGRVPAVHIPPEMTCGFLIQLVFCKKKICGLLGLKNSKRRVHPLLKKSWIRPCLRKGVLKRRTPTGSELFAILAQWLCPNHRADRLYKSKEFSNINLL